MLSPRKIAQRLALSDRNIEELLALRLLFDDPRDIVDLDQDIKDLEFFPERLTTSYRQEWITYICRAIAAQCKSVEDEDERAYAGTIQSKANELQDSDNERYRRLLVFVNRAQGISENDNVVSMPNPLRKRLEDFLML